MINLIPSGEHIKTIVYTSIATTILTSITLFIQNKINDFEKYSMNALNNKMGNMHQMPDGSMMMNHGADMMDMTMRDMVGMLEGKTGKALEKEFIVGMIPHHQGAVDMSKKMLQDKTISAEMRKFAEQIITAQESEIKMMNEWLKKY